MHGTVILAGGFHCKVCSMYQQEGYPYDLVKVVD